MSEKTYHTSIIYYTRNTYCDLSHLASVAILLRSFLTCPSCSSLGGVCTGGMNTVFPLWYENGQGILGILRLLHHLSLWQNEIYTFQRPCLNHEKIWTLFTSFSPPWWLWPPSKRIPKGWLPLLLPKLWGLPKMDKVVEKRPCFCSHDMSLHICLSGCIGLKFSCLRTLWTIILYGGKQEDYLIICFPYLIYPIE